MLPVLEKYRAIIRDYKISVFEEAGSSFRLRALVYLIDGSELHVRETLSAVRSASTPITGSLATAVCSCAGIIRRIGMSRHSRITNTLGSREMWPLLTSERWSKCWGFWPKACWRVEPIRRSNRSDFRAFHLVARSGLPLDGRADVVDPDAHPINHARRRVEPIRLPDASPYRG